MIRRLAWLALALPAAVCAQVGLYQSDCSSALGQVFDVGTASPGDVITTSFCIRNSGNAGVVVQDIKVAGADFSAAGLPVLPYTLAPGFTVNFKVAFAPQVIATSNASLIVVTPQRTLSAFLAGEAVSAISVLYLNAPLGAGAAVDFGSVQVGGSVALQFSLQNRGPSALTVNSISVSGGGFSPPSGIETPLTLAPGASAPFQIAFSPADPTSAAGRLSVDGRTFALLGSGFNAAFPAASIQFDRANASSAMQRQVSIDLQEAAKRSGDGLLTIAFQPGASVPGASADSAIVFLQGNPSTAPVHVNKGDNFALIGGARSAAFQTGTTAGTISFTLTLTGNGPVTQTLPIPPAAVHFDTVTGARTPGQLSVGIVGFDNTHAASKMSFTFFDATGGVVQPGVIAVDVAAAFLQYFGGNANGGAFSLLARFPVTGDATRVAAAQVEVTNPTGPAQTQKISF